MIGALQSTCTAACRWLVTAGVLMLAGLAVGDAKAQDQAQDPAAKGSTYFDDFDRNDLGDKYSIIDPDPNRLTLSGGKLVIVGTNPRKNIVLLKDSIPGDFVATVMVSMEVGQNNFVGLRYHIDQKNYLVVGIAGGTEIKQVFTEKYLSGVSNRRQPFFLKAINEEVNLIAPYLSELGDRRLEGFSPNVENWYFQMRREGARYTGLVSTDGVHWARIGSHVMVQPYGQLGFIVGSGGGIENAAEFDIFSVQQ